MGTIRQYTKLDKNTGKTIQKYRAEIRRTGFESKSAILATESAAKKWIRDNDAASTLIKAGSGLTVEELIEEFGRDGHCAYASMYQLEYWTKKLGRLRVRDVT